MVTSDADEGAETYSADYVMQLRQEADRRVLAAELKGEAMRAGLIDPDGLKLLDLSAVRLGEDGKLELPDGFFEAARKAKPFLFRQHSTASVAKAPDAAPMRSRNAVEMSYDEWQAARIEIMRRS